VSRTVRKRRCSPPARDESFESRCAMPPPNGPVAQHRPSTGLPIPNGSKELSDTSELRVDVRLSDVADISGSKDARFLPYGA
jgi:hypothetical protein